MLDSSQLTTLIGPITLRPNDPEYFRTSDSMLMFRLTNPLRWDGSSHFLLEISTGGAGFSVSTNTMGSMMAYLQTNAQLPTGRTLTTSSVSKMAFDGSSVVDMRSYPAALSTLSPADVSVQSHPYAPAIIFALFSTAVPTISSISPASGSIRGGTVITIFGTNLGNQAVDLLAGGGALISVDASTAMWRPLCSVMQWLSSSQVTCVVASVSINDPTLPSSWLASPQNITIRTASSGRFLSNFVLFQYSKSPVIATLTDVNGNPISSGVVNGGTSIRINGEVCDLRQIESSYSF
jgi:hypothetical protein